MSYRECDWRRSERRWNRKTNGNGCQKQIPRQRGSTDSEKGRDENDDTVDFQDPEYRSFLRNLKEHESSYKVVVYGGNGEPEEVVYETDDHLPVDRSTREEDVQRSRRPGLEDDDEEEEYLGFLNPGLRERDIDHGDSGDGGERDYVQLLNRIGDGTSRPPETRPVSGGDIVGEDCSEFEDRDLVGEDCNDLSDDDDDDVCKTYLEFLGLVEKGGLAKFGDDDEDSEADTDVVLMEKGLHFEENSTPFVSTRSPHVIDVETYRPGKDSTARNSRFKKELLECLKKPYDSKQYQELKSDFECRKPQMEDRKLRGKTKTYESKDKLGKSYRDQHRDFAELIDLAKKENRRSLNLLRGFFYWMKNIAQVGAFKPWHDPSILEILPEK